MGAGGENVKELVGAKLVVEVLPAAVAYTANENVNIIISNIPIKTYECRFIRSLLPSARKNEEALII
jgi:hypothetical protein